MIKEHGRTWGKHTREERLITYQCDGENEMGLMFGWPKTEPYVHHQERMSWVRVELKRIRAWDDNDHLKHAIIGARMTFTTANENPNIGPGMTCTFGRIHGKENQLFDPKFHEIEWMVVSAYGGEDGPYITVNCEAKGGFPSTTE